MKQNGISKKFILLEMKKDLDRLCNEKKSLDIKYDDIYKKINMLNCIVFTVLQLVKILDGQYINEKKGIEVLIDFEKMIKIIQPSDCKDNEIKKYRKTHLWEYIKSKNNEKSVDKGLKMIHK